MNLSSAEIRREIRTFLLQEFLPGEDATVITDETPLFTQGVLDSISILRLVLFMEKRFKIKLRAQDITRRHFDTIASAAELVFSCRSRNR